MKLERWKSGNNETMKYVESSMQITSLMIYKFNTRGGEGRNIRFVMENIVILAVSVRHECEARMHLDLYDVERSFSLNYVYSSVCGCECFLHEGFQ